MDLLNLFNSTAEVEGFFKDPKKAYSFFEELEQSEQSEQAAGHIFDFIGDGPVWSSDLYQVLYPDTPDMGKLNKYAWAATKIDSGRFEEGADYTIGCDDYSLSRDTAMSFVMTEETEIGHLFRQALINKEKELRLREVMDKIQKGLYLAL